MPDLIRYYLGEEPILPNVDTWRLGDADAREEVLDRLDELVLKPVDGSGGKGIVIGPRATPAELDELRGKVLAGPARLDRPAGRAAVDRADARRRRRCGPRHVDLRPFAVNDGDRVWVLPGGLTRVALPEGELVVNSSRGGGSKDTWVLAGPAQSSRRRRERRARRPRRHAAEPAAPPQQRRRPAARARRSGQPEHAQAAAAAATGPGSRRRTSC